MPYVLQNAVAEWVAVLIVELFEVINVQHDQCHACALFLQGLFQQARERVAVEYLCPMCPGLPQGGAFNCRRRLAISDWAARRR